MNKIYLIINFVILLPSVIFAGTHDKREYATSLFSIMIPAQMKIDDAEENHVSLIFNNDEDLALGTISISAKKFDKGIDTNNLWQKRRSLMIAGKIIKSEDEVELSGLKWKRIALSDASGSCEITNVSYYGVTDDVTYSIYYNCIERKCESITKAFAQIIDSFRRK